MPAASAQMWQAVHTICLTAGVAMCAGYQTHRTLEHDIPVAHDEKNPGHASAPHNDSANLHTAHGTVQTLLIAMAVNNSDFFCH